MATADSEINDGWINYMHEVSQELALKEYLLNTHTTDPRLEKERIKLIAGHWVEASFNWILEQEHFRRWENTDEARLLWIKGSPGQGKTTLLTAIIDQLERRLKKQPHEQSTTVLSYFFCDAGNRNLNTSTAVVRGLIYLLSVQNPLFFSHPQKQGRTTDSELLEDANAFSSLSKLLKDMLQEAGLSRAYIVIDGLDECNEGLLQLLEFIVENTSTLPHVKWLLSSRPIPDIAAKLGRHDAKVHIDLDRNTPETAFHIHHFLDAEVSRFWPILSLGEYSDRLRSGMNDRARGNFLWVKLAVAELSEGLARGENVRHLFHVLENMPLDVEALYQLSLARIPKYLWRISKSCLALVTLAYRPVSLAELNILTGPHPGEMSGDTREVREVVYSCWPLLQLFGDYIFFIHLTAKEYLSKKNSAFPSGHTALHRHFFTRSLEAMSILRRDIYNLGRHGVRSGKIEASEFDPLAAVRYSCVHWIDHLRDAFSVPPMNRIDTHALKLVDHFLRTKFPNWIEALSLIQCMGDAIRTMTILESLLTEQSSDHGLLSLVRDLAQFVVKNRQVLENSPLQIHVMVKKPGWWKEGEDREVEASEARRMGLDMGSSNVATFALHEEPAEAANTRSNSSSMAPINNEILPGSDPESFFSSGLPLSSTPPTSTNQPGVGIPAANDEQAQLNDDYSDAGSIAGFQDMYANVLQKELLQDLKNLELRDGTLEPLLGLCLQEFAVRLGHQGSSQDHKDMMYVAHKYHENIARAICQGQRELQNLSLVEESIESHDESLQDEVSPPVGDTSIPLPLYGAGHTIDDWSSKIEQTELLDISSTEPGPRGEKLTFEHDTLRKSQASQWLVSTIQRRAEMMDIQPSQMDKHRSWLLDTLESITPRERKQSQRISRRRKPPIYTVNLDLSLDLIGFIRDQEYPKTEHHSIVSRVITLSGDGRFVQALPCKEYMEQIWPTSGPHVVRLLDDLAERPNQRHICTLPDETDVAVELRGRSVVVEATGTKYGLAEVTEQLFWVSTALQTPTLHQGMSLNVAKPYQKVVTSIDGSFRPSIRPGGLGVEHVGTVNCAVTFESEHPSNSLGPSTGDCWQQLFRHCAVVKGYPILSRSSKHPGLEIPFSMMAGLASAERIALFGNDLIVKGHSTILFPTLLYNDCIFWHLICNDDGSRISFADQRIPLTTKTASSDRLRPDDIHYARHVVGWAANVDQNTGRIGANHNIGWSRLGEPSPGFVLEKVSISAGKYINVSGTFVRGTRDKPLRVLGDDYRKQLDDIGEQFVVLHDIETRKAWLVDGLSVLLHLTYANLAYADDTLSLLKPGDLQLRGGDGGPMAALTALTSPINTALRVRRKLDKPDIEEYVHLVDTIKYTIHILEQIFDQQADKRESSVGYGIRASPWAQMEGFDFKDIAMQSNRISPRATALQVDGEGWVKFTREIHAPTLFGTGFGDLLKPVPASQGGRNQCVKCYWNEDMPPDRDILAVAGSDLERIIERRGAKTAHRWRVINELYLDITPELFSECLDPSSHKKHPGCQQRVVQIQHGTNTEEPRVWGKLVSKFKSPRKGSQATTQAPLDISAGGILLGMPPKRHLKLPNVLLSPSSSIRAGSPFGSSSAIPSSGSTNLTAPSK